MKFPRIILLFLAVGLFTSADCGAADDNAQLVKAIFQVLTNQCPNVDSNTIVQETAWLAWQLKDATISKASSDSLTEMLSANQALKLNGWQAAQAASEICGSLKSTNSSSGTLAFNPPVQPAPSSAEISNLVGTVNGLSNSMSQISGKLFPTNVAPVLSKYFYIEAGTVILRPFSIDPVTGRLNANSADVRGMIDGVFKTRYAWRNDATNSDFEVTNSVVWGFNHTPTFDYEVQLGYAFGNGTSQNSSAPGSGDAYGEASFGWNMLRIRQGADVASPLYTFNLEMFGAFVTDKSDFSIHPTIGAGVSFVAGIPWLNAASNPDHPKCELLTRLGYADLDSITVNKGIVTTDNVGNPVFSMKGAAQIKAELRLPVIPLGSDGKSGYGFLSFGGTFDTIYEGGPDTWSMYAAVSFPIEGLLRAIPQF